MKNKWANPEFRHKVTYAMHRGWSEKKLDVLINSNRDFVMV